MSIIEIAKQKVYNKIADYLSVVRGYFIGSLYGPSWARKLAHAEEDLRKAMKDSIARLARLRENYAYADRFLKKFRENRPDWAYSAQEKPQPDSNCNHLKGGRFRLHVGHKDYNVAGHTFPNGKIKIWCLNNCGFESYPGDANWKTALIMMEDSSNKLSSSERIFFANKTYRDNRTVVTVQDKI